MARYTDASCKLCRREGEKLFLKGERCYANKCSITRRAQPPGQHTQLKKKMSEYGMQLREKQKARRFYGILENQFRKYFEMAANKKGITGEILLQTLERRIDNIVYRLGMATSRAEARQLVRHGHFTVNGKKVNIPSCLLKVDDIIELADKSKGLAKMKEINETAGGKTIPKWLEMDRENMKGRVAALPLREDIDLQVREHLIVELYSK